MKNMEFERQNALEFRNPIRRNLFEGFRTGTLTVRVLKPTSFDFIGSFFEASGSPTCSASLASSSSGRDLCFIRPKPFFPVRISFCFHSTETCGLLQRPQRTLWSFGSMFRRSGLNSFERPDEPAVCMPWFASMLVRTPSRPPRHVVPPHIAGCRVVRLQRTTSGSIPAAELLEVLSGIGLGLGNGCVLSNLTL